MKILIFSDLHLGKHKFVSEQDGLDVLKYICKYALDNKIPSCLFGGDFFDKGEVLTPNILVKTKYTFETTYHFPLFPHYYMISGQHDAEDFEGSITAVDVISCLEMNLCSYNKIGETLIENYKSDEELCRLIYAQHNRDTTQLQNDLLNHQKRFETSESIFLGHFLVDEILEANGMSNKIKGDISFEKHLKHLNCDHYFIGDYHKHVHIPELNLTSIGTCCPTSFRDEGCTASFLIYDTKLKQFERKLIKDSPFFGMPNYDYIMTDEVMELYKNWGDKSFIRVKVKTKEQKEKLMEKNQGVLNLEILIEDEEQIANEKRLDVDYDVAPIEVVKKYCEYIGVDDAFIRKGLEYL